MSAAQQNNNYVHTSVQGFCRRGKALLEANPPAQADFVKYMLSGLDGDLRVVVNPMEDRLEDDESITLRRDIDSLLGIEDDICVDRDLTVYPIPRKEDTLTKNIHIESQFTSVKGAFTAPVHKVPNLCIAKWDTHTMIRVLLPGLYSDTRKSPLLSQDEMRIFYEQGFRPAMVDLDEVGATEWPSTYDNEMFRARGNRGTLSFQSKVIDSLTGVALGDKIRECLRENGHEDYATGLVFLHQIRGVKSTTIHQPTATSATQALRSFLTNHSIRIGHGRWWIDIGLEISSDDNNCLAWRTDSHPHVAKNVLRILANTAKRVTSPGSSKGTRDILSGMPGVSGLRLSPGARAQGAFRAQYLQLYTTDKATIYRPDNGHYGKYLTCSDVLKGKDDAFIDKLYTLYRDAIGKNTSCARVECRVPLEFANSVLLDFSESLARRSLVSFHPTTFWSLRAYRAQACRFALNWQAEGEAQFREKRPALLLTMAIVWLLNGLHSTPDKGSACRELMASVLPHVRRADADENILAYGSPTADDDVLSISDDENEQAQPLVCRNRATPDTAPSYSRGLVFFRPVRIGDRYPVPRFENEQTFISIKAFKFFFGISEDQISMEYFRQHAIRPANPNRVKNKVQRTRLYHNWGPDEQSNDFNLGQLGVTLPPPAWDGGSDMEYSDGPPSDEEVIDDVDVALTALWRQLLLDITTKAPNPRGAAEASYVRLGPVQRLEVNQATYQNADLSAYFHACRWKLANKIEWQRAFNNLFPDSGTVRTGAIQNYGSMTYFAKWGVLRDRADAETVVKMKRALKSKFDTLYWMPFATKDRVWWTKALPEFQRFPLGAPLRASPLVLINSLILPTWEAAP